jgi:hypothetical protein
LKNGVFEELVKDVQNCSGCFWVYPFMVEQLGEQILDFRSELWKRRLK